MDLMGFPWIISTIDEPMSSYTAMAFSFVFIVAPILLGFGYYWMKREFNNINDKIGDHDGFVERTSKDSSKLTTDVAVLLERCSRSQEDIESIKKSIDDVQHTLLVMSKK